MGRKRRQEGEREGRTEEGGKSEEGRGWILRAEESWGGLKQTTVSHRMLGETALIEENPAMWGRRNLTGACCGHSGESGFCALSRAGRMGGK